MFHPSSYDGKRLNDYYSFEYFWNALASTSACC